MPAEASEVGRGSSAAQGEIHCAEPTQRVGERPGPVTVKACHPAKSIQLLLAPGEPVTVRGELIDVEAALTQVVLIPVAAEPARVVIGREMHERGKRCRQHQLAAGLEESRELVERLRRFRDVLQDFAAENGIERRVGLWNRGDVGDEIYAARIPLPGMKTLAVTRTFVAAEVLRNVEEVSA